MADDSSEVERLERLLKLSEGELDEYRRQVPELKRQIRLLTDAKEDQARMLRENEASIKKLREGTKLAIGCHVNAINSLTAERQELLVELAKLKRKLKAKPKPVRQPQAAVAFYPAGFID